MKPITYTPIGIIHTSFTDQEGTPIQPLAGKGVRGTIEIFPEYLEGLQDVDGFSHLILLFHMHKAGPGQLRARPYLDDTPRGIFAIRGPRRPNPMPWRMRCN